MVICEGYVITPNIIGMRFTMSPLSVFLSLVFWTWLWGPVGGVLSVPLIIVGVAAFSHMFPTRTGNFQVKGCNQAARSGPNIRS